MRKLWLATVGGVVAVMCCYLVLSGLQHPRPPSLLFLEGEEPLEDYVVEYGWGHNQVTASRVRPYSQKEHLEPFLVRTQIYSINGDFEGISRYLDGRIKELGGSSLRWNPFDGRWFVGDDLDIYVSSVNPSSDGDIFVRVAVRRELGAGGYFVRFFRSPLRALRL